jgi:hypothetical protein
MNREVHVRFFEGLRVQPPWATHLWTMLVMGGIAVLLMALNMKMVARNAVQAIT